MRDIVSGLSDDEYIEVLDDNGDEDDDEPVSITYANPSRRDASYRITICN